MRPQKKTDFPWWKASLIVRPYKTRSWDSLLKRTRGHYRNTKRSHLYTHTRIPPLSLLTFFLFLAQFTRLFLFFLSLCCFVFIVCVKQKKKKEATPHFKSTPKSHTHTVCVWREIYWRSLMRCTCNCPGSSTPFSFVHDDWGCCCLLVSFF